MEFSSTKLCCCRKCLGFNWKFIGKFIHGDEINSGVVLYIQFANVHNFAWIYWFNVSVCMSEWSQYWRTYKIIRIVTLTFWSAFSLSLIWYVGSITKRVDKTGSHCRRPPYILYTQLNVCTVYIYILAFNHGICHTSYAYELSNRIHRELFEFGK